jgi:hypothetical protein
MQKLEIYQSLWGMELRSPHVPERAPEESFAMVAEAGFDGMCMDPGVSEIDGMRPLQELYRKHQLRCMVNAFPYSEDDMQPLLEFAKEFDAWSMSSVA